MASTFLMLLDDVTLMVRQGMASAKVAAAAAIDDAALASKKAAGVVVDDAAVVPQYANGVHPSRELPMVFKMAIGSLINKTILIPLALLASAFVPAAIPVALAIGAAVLCFEGFESVLEKYFGHGGHDDKPTENPQSAEAEMARVKNAVKTDFILSAEIVVIALGAVMTQPLMNQAMALIITGLGITIGVYGTVALIVKMDDMGLAVVRFGIARQNNLLMRSGKLVVDAMPGLLSGLSHLGTWAMLMVGGGIYAHHLTHYEQFNEIVNIGMPVGLVISALIGIAAGAVLVGIYESAKKIHARIFSNGSN